MYKNFPSITVCRRFQSFLLLQADKSEIAKTMLLEIRKFEFKDHHQLFLLELQNLKQLMSVKKRKKKL